MTKRWNKNRHISSAWLLDVRGFTPKLPHFFTKKRKRVFFGWTVLVVKQVNIEQQCTRQASACVKEVFICHKHMKTTESSVWLYRDQKHQNPQELEGQQRWRRPCLQKKRPPCKPCFRITLSNQSLRQTLSWSSCQEQEWRLPRRGVHFCRASFCNWRNSGWHLSKASSQ